LKKPDGKSDIRYDKTMRDLHKGKKKRSQSGSLPGKSGGTKTKNNEKTKVMTGDQTELQKKKSVSGRVKTLTSERVRQGHKEAQIGVRGEITN